MSDEDRDVKLLSDAANQLGEHFDAVHIFASRHEAETEDGTVTVNSGVGNWHARIGQIKAWIIRHNEYERVKYRDENNR